MNAYLMNIIKRHHHHEGNRGQSSFKKCNPFGTNNTNININDSGNFTVNENAYHCSPTTINKKEIQTPHQYHLYPQKTNVLPHHPTNISRVVNSSTETQQCSVNTKKHVFNSINELNVSNNSLQQCQPQQYSNNNVTFCDSPMYPAKLSHVYPQTSYYFPHVTNSNNKNIISNNNNNAYTNTNADMLLSPTSNNKLSYTQSTPTNDNINEFLEQMIDGCEEESIFHLGLNKMSENFFYANDSKNYLPQSTTKFLTSQENSKKNNTNNQSTVTSSIHSQEQESSLDILSSFQSSISVESISQNQLLTNIDNSFCNDYVIITPLFSPILPSFDKNNNNDNNVDLICVSPILNNTNMLGHFELNSNNWDNQINDLEKISCLTSINHSLPTNLISNNNNNINGTYYHMSIGNTVQYRQY